MAGPVLLKQSHDDAKTSVDSRLGYIEGEIKRVEALIMDLQDKFYQKRTEIVQTQVALQGAVGGGE
jgi:prefoldin beta subunit